MTPKMDQDLVDRIVAEEAARSGFTGPIRITQGAAFEGVMHDFTAPQIHIIYDPEYERRTRLQQFPQRAEQILRSLVRHEINHKGYAPLPGAPGSLDKHIELLEVISERCRAAGLPNVSVGNQHTLYTYMANMFADVIDNSQLGLRTDHTGAFLMYKDDIQDKRFSPLFDAFVRTQEYIYGKKKTKRLLRAAHAKDDRVKVAVQGFITDAELSRDRLDKLFQPDTWNLMAKTFIERMIPLIDKQKLENQEYIEATFLPLENGFPKELLDEQTQMGEVWKKYVQGEGKKGGVFHPPAYLDNNDALRLLYQRMARNLEIKVRHSTQEQRMPVMQYGLRQFDPETDNFSRARLRVSPQGSLELHVRPYSVEIAVEYQEHPHTLPDIHLAILDTSSSTQEELGSKHHPKILNPWAQKEKQWSDDAIYHYELLVWFGLVEYLRKQGALRKTSVHLANFSSNTIYASNLDDAYTLALSPHFGGTVLDVDAVFQKGKNKSLLFSLSDGDIQNWGDIQEDFIRKAKENYYFHFQIGQPTQMSQDLQNAGLPVFYDDGRTVAKKVIDLTRPFVAKGKAVWTGAAQ